MGWVSGALISLVTLAGLETSAEFTELWYREVLLGEVHSAASTYDRVYTKMPPWQGSTEDERRIAALRAGLCFESLGRASEARHAYDWLLHHGVHRSAIVDLARARLGEMVRSGMLPPDADPYATARRGDVLVREGLADHLKTAMDEVSRGATDLEVLRRDLSRLTEEVELIRSLRERIATHGAAVFAGSGAVFATSGNARAGDGGTVATRSSRSTRSTRSTRAQPSSGLRRTLETQLRAVLAEGFSFEAILPGVADAFCGAALRAVSTGDLAAAKRLFEQALALAGHHAAAQDFVQRLDSGQDSRHLRDLARRYLLEERLRQIGELQDQVRERLARARLAREGLARPDSGVSVVVQIWQMVDRSLPEVRLEAEISHLVREADRLFVALTAGVYGPDDKRAPGEELREVLEKRKSQIDEARGLVRQIVELTFEKVAMDEATTEPARSDTIKVVAVEIQRLLAEGRAFLTGGAVTECARSVREAELLLSWFPGVDPQGQYRVQRRRLQQNLELKRDSPEFQKGLDGQQ